MAGVGGREKCWDEMTAVVSKTLLDTRHVVGASLAIISHARVGAVMLNGARCTR